MHRAAAALRPHTAPQRPGGQKRAVRTRAHPDPSTLSTRRASHLHPAAFQVSPSKGTRQGNLLQPSNPNHRRTRVPLRL